jgi:hypothetical protein
MRSCAFLFAMSILSVPCLAQTTFFLSPGPSIQGSTPWANAVGSIYSVFDFESLQNGALVDDLQAGSIRVDVGLGGLNGTAPTAEIFYSSLFPQYGGAQGTVFSNSLLNRDSSSLEHSRIVFEFSVPVHGVGLWVFDDLSTRINNGFVLHAVDATNTVTVSPVLDSGNGTTWAVDGFLGVVSPAGITRIEIEQLDLATGLPSIDDYFEIDTLQIGTAIPSVRSYGAGWPGTLGAPSLSALQGPVLGGSTLVSIGNSSGTTTQGLLLAGFAAAAVPTALGGTVLVNGATFGTYSIPAVGLPVNLAVPDNPALMGLRVFMQALELDSGASQGVAFSQGLELTIGQ